MGVSTNGILFYGFPVDADSDIHTKLDPDSDNLVAKLYGWDGVNPQYSFEWEKTHPSPVTAGAHCSCDYTMYYIAIKASETIARRGYPKEVSPITQPEWDDQLRDFCNRLGVKLEPEVKFGWYLVSMWC